MAAHPDSHESGHAANVTRFVGNGIPRECLAAID